MRGRKAAAALGEVAAVSALAALYPLGVADAAMSRALDASVPGYARCRTGSDIPVLLVHGFGANKSGWLFVQRALRRAGWTVRSYNYSPFTHDVPALGSELARRVRQLLADTGAEQVHLIGHSLGGVLIRYAVTYCGIAEQVHTAITVLSPHHGSPVAHVGLGAHLRGLGDTARQLRPGSPLLEQLDRDCTDGRIRWIAYYAEHDLVVPAASARLTNPALHADNIRVSGPGHVAVLLTHGVIGSLVRRLRASENDAACGHAPPG